MKKIFLVMALSLSLFAIQSCDNDKKETKDEKTVSTTDVPAPVQTAFSAKYSTATDVKWEDAHENNVQTYKAKFMLKIVKQSFFLNINTPDPMSGKRMHRNMYPFSFLVDNL
jgi:hypothetical protein